MVLDYPNVAKSMDTDHIAILFKKSRVESGQSEGLVVSRVRSIEHGHSDGDAFGSGRRKSMGRSKYCSGNKIQCRYCKDYGHIKRGCPKLKKKRDKQGDGNKSENSSSANVAVAYGDLVESSELLVVNADSSSAGQCASSASADCDISFSTGWVLDSTGSYHMCPHRVVCHL